MDGESASYSISACYRYPNISLHWQRRRSAIPNTYPHINIHLGANADSRTAMGDAGTKRSYCSHSPLSSHWHPSKRESLLHFTN